MADVVARLSYITLMEQAQSSLHHKPRKTAVERLVSVLIYLEVFEAYQIEYIYTYVRRYA